VSEAAPQSGGSLETRHPGLFRFGRICVKAGVYLGVAGIGCALGVFVVIRLSFHNTKVTVPKVVGMTLEQARFQAERRHLALQVQSRRYDLSIPKGKIIQQDPQGAMTVRRGQTLLVVVSKGVESTKLPEWRNVRLDQAQISVKQLGLTLASVSYISSPEQTQTVLAQTPPAGTIVPKDAQVSLLVSSGRSDAVFVMPDLRGRLLQNVRLMMRRYGIQVGAARSRPSPGTPTGTVLSQTPLPGYPLSRSQIVQLVVSSQ
jgi:eukaryotic-like serine/threonine-protein kinase